MAVTASTSASGVLLFIPNLIGYLRVVCTLIFVFTGLDESKWQLAISSYVMSFVADLFDGMAARYFKQSSKFGAVLDMVTDRCSTALLLSVLAILYRNYAQLFMLLMALDIASHWVQMKAAGKMHHKSSSQNFVVRFYYSNYAFFGYCCVGAEFFYIFLYMLHFLHGAQVPTIEGRTWESVVYDVTFYVMLPGCCLKQFVNLCQLCAASLAIAQVDAEDINAKSSH